MAGYSDNNLARISDLLRCPLQTRLMELPYVLERCSLRELQDVFPTLIQSIFGLGSNQLGWGLRVTTRENSPQCFDLLHQFFVPMGAMFRMCYRLLNENIKFDMHLEQLPLKLVEMLQSGQYAMFYADLLNVDPFRRQITSLSLNAFDFYMLHFVMYAIFPLHKVFPSALQVHNERIKTVYFCLACDYMHTFLPGHPNEEVLPANICINVKPVQALPVQPLQLKPKKSPKYLKLPNSLQFDDSSSSGNANNLSSSRELPEAREHFAWRTETVLHFFTDVWLRFDISQVIDPPSSEFLRVVRQLIKFLHIFANSAVVDQTNMLPLRKLAHPMLKARFYAFFKRIIARWPLDSSFVLVVELWLCFIQPWRYVYGRANNVSVKDLHIDRRFDAFIMDNLVAYTQIFVHILPRFERLDFSNLDNVELLVHFVDVLGQTTLPRKLMQAEQNYVINNLDEFGSPQKHSSSLLRRSPSAAATTEWDSFTKAEYVPMFGNAMQDEVERFLRTVFTFRLSVRQEIHALQEQLTQRTKNIGFFKKWFRSSCPLIENQLKNLRPIPDWLEYAIYNLASIFQIEIDEVSFKERDAECLQPSKEADDSLSFYDSDNDRLDLSKLSPRKMQDNVAKLESAVDPATLPIATHECEILVKLFNEISASLNAAYGAEMQLFWDRRDFIGKLTRQILCPPVTTQRFDKSSGISELCETHLPARLCLRPFASFKLLFWLAVSYVLGHILFGSPFFGLIIVFIIFAFNVLLRAIIL